MIRTFWEVRNNVTTFGELFTRRYWRFRKASRILQHARFQLCRRNVVGSDWEAIGILLGAYWEAEDEYYTARRKA